MAKRRVPSRKKTTTRRPTPKPRKHPPPVAKRKPSPRDAIVEKRVSNRKKSEVPSAPKPGLAMIPSMTVLLAAAEKHAALARQPRAVVTAALREELEALRAKIKLNTAKPGDGDAEGIITATARRIDTRSAGRLVRVINATGIVLHTGLGRSPLPAEAVQRLTDVAAGYCNLEIDMPSGERGLRGGYVESLLRELTGAEAALVVNNNAAATMLALRALARDREVIVSRGQLIEIGGSYRLPEVMAAGGATLREVGTTNRTHLRDYERAIGETTALIMHVHTSNYRVVGFTRTPGTAELARLAHARGLMLFDDLGSGALTDDDLWRNANEPTVIESLKNGADLVAFSGDKLLGGPQAGILLGNRDIIDRLRADPAARALRVGKLTLAALEAVLELYHDSEAARIRIPVLARLSQTATILKKRADALSKALTKAAPREAFTVAPDESYAGGGSLPAWPLKTFTVRWTPRIGQINDVARRLRLGVPAILPRIADGAIVFDLRTIDDSEFADLARIVAAHSR